MEENFVHYLSYVLGCEERPLTCLADCRSLVTWNALNYLAAQQIGTVPAVMCGTHKPLEAKSLGGRYIIGVEEIMRRFIRNGEFPSGQEIPWSCRGGKATPADTARLHSLIREMISHTAADCDTLKMVQYG